MASFPPRCTAQDYYRVVYSSDECIRKFHHAVNKDPSATATAWEGGKRRVSFKMPLNVPGMIKNMIGARPGLGAARA
jgi:hypothetical protein